MAPMPSSASTEPFCYFLPVIDVLPALANFHKLMHTAGADDSYRVGRIFLS